MQEKETSRLITDAEGNFWFSGTVSAVPFGTGKSHLHMLLLKDSYNIVRFVCNGEKGRNFDMQEIPVLCPDILLVAGTTVSHEYIEKAVNSKQQLKKGITQNFTN